jgi:hypothetical protein
MAGIFVVGAGLAAGLAACVVYEPAPGVYSSTPSGAPSAFERSWYAVVGAFGDEGVQIVKDDRAAGTLVGRFGDIGVTASVRQQANGSVQVEFGVSGNIAANPSLKDRIVGSYNRRMGR